MATGIDYDEDLVTIERKRLIELEETEAYAMALDNAGVDNWSGYSYAMEEVDGDD